MFEPCRKAAECLSKFNGQWGIAGGWAIDLFIGQKTRCHSDIEVAILRADQLELKHALPDWTFAKAVKGELVSWDEEWLQLPVHEIHSVHKLNDERVEFLLNETSGGAWIFRRDSSITFSACSLFLNPNEGIPYLNPAIVLLYKAKNSRAKDHADFYAVHDLLKTEDKEWLRNALQVHVPSHKWIHEL